MRGTPTGHPAAFLALLAALLLQAGQAWAQGDARAPIVTNSVDMTFVLVPAGRFLMGAGPGFRGDGEYERPAHEVSISRPFRLSRGEVTFEQWNRVMGGVRFYGEKGRKGQRGLVPIDNVSWEDATEFVARLNELEGTSKYRLPTEAEWEYAARAGTATAYFFGDDPAGMAAFAWCGEGFAQGGTHPVMTREPNQFGLHDMLGNVSEWVADWFSPSYYGPKASRDPRGPASGEEKVHRGGAFASDPKTCQAAWRESDLPGLRSLNIGFRVARDE
ncbi:MAG: formylglycine-generating enzyme family protein [Deltaproteobacteria bacterium]|nr:formylglycine-generating enzyme family protein [Deltaproteobacteria bacterium]